MSKCSFCNKQTHPVSTKSFTEGWGYLEVRKAGWKESLIVIHCPKHAKEYVEFLYLLGAVTTIEKAKCLIDSRKESGAVARLKDVIHIRRPNDALVYD